MTKKKTAPAVNDERREWLKNTVLRPPKSQGMKDIVKRYKKDFGIRAKIEPEELHKMATKIQAEAKKEVAKKKPATKKAPSKKKARRKKKSKKHNFLPEQETYLLEAKPPIAKGFNDKFGLKLLPNSIHSKRYSLRKKAKDTESLPAPSPKTRNRIMKIPREILVEVDGKEVFRGPEGEIKHTVVLNGEVVWTGPTPPKNIDVFVKKP